MKKYLILTLACVILRMLVFSQDVLPEKYVLRKNRVKSISECISTSDSCDVLDHIVNYWEVDTFGRVKTHKFTLGFEINHLPLSIGKDTASLKTFSYSGNRGNNISTTRFAREYEVITIASFPFSNRKTILHDSFSIVESEFFFNDSIEIYYANYIYSDKLLKRIEYYMTDTNELILTRCFRYTYY